MKDGYGIYRVYTYLYIYLYPPNDQYRSDLLVVFC
jgi:hypothetical protein